MGPPSGGYATARDRKEKFLSRRCKKPVPTRRDTGAMGATAIDHRRILERLEPAGTRRSAVELATLLNESPPRVRRALSDLTRAGLVMALRTGGRITFERRPAHHHRHPKMRVPAGVQSE